MNSEGRVSILTTAHNPGPSIGRCISSVQQAGGVFEHIVVDDGSTDFDRWAFNATDNRNLRLLQCPRIGRPRALQLGLENACGEYIAILDADDATHKDRFRIQSSFLDSHADIAGVGSSISMWSPEGRHVGDFHYPTTSASIRSELEKLNSPIPHSTLMARRLDMLAVGGYREYFKKAQDYDLLLRLVQTHKLVSIDEILTRYTLSESSLTTDESVQSQMYFAVVAYGSHSCRIRHGFDPLTTAPIAFSNAIAAWYIKTRYPDIFKSRMKRRSALLARSRGQTFAFFSALAAATMHDLFWPLRRLTGKSSALNEEIDSFIDRIIDQRICNREDIPSGTQNTNSKFDISNPPAD